jgi:hypothetical protein
MDFTNSNRAMRQMLQLMMQRMMGEESLERQKEYVDYSSDVYGKRQRENLEATEASRLRIGEVEHERTMQEKAAALNTELLKMPYFDRLARQYQAGDQSVLPELSAGATLIGNMYDLGQTGQPIPQEMWSEATKYGDMSDIYKIFDRVSSNITARGTREDSAANRAQRETAGARTAGIQERRLGLDTKKYELDVEKQKGKASPGAVPEKPRFQAIVTAADKAQAALLKMMDLGEGEAGDMAAIQKRVAQIRNRGILGGWSSKAAQAADLAFLEKIYEPAKAAESLRAQDWLAEQEAARATPGATAPATPAPAPAVDQVSELTVKLIARGVPKDIARQMAEEYFRGR